MRDLPDAGAGSPGPLHEVTDRQEWGMAGAYRTIPEVADEIAPCGAKSLGG